MKMDFGGGVEGRRVALAFAITLEYRDSELYYVRNFLCFTIELLKKVLEDRKSKDYLLCSPFCPIQ